MDIFSTICNVANAEFPLGHTIDGFDLQEQFNGEEISERDELFLNHFPHGNHRSNYFTSLVSSDWKIVYHYQIDGQPRYELFNLKDDPFEKNDLADKDLKQLKTMMELLSDELNSKKALYPEKDGELLGVILPE